jgi:hypothetical protein
MGIREGKPEFNIDKIFTDSKCPAFAFFIYQTENNGKFTTSGTKENYQHPS